MSEFPSLLNNTAVRILVVYLIPGALVFYVPIDLLRSGHGIADEFISKEPILQVGFFVLGALFFGALLEDIGGWIEAHIFDRIYSDRPSGSVDEVHSVWYKYLSLQWGGGEPVGQSYLRTILQRMKFELSSSIAVVIFGVYFSIFKIGVYYGYCGVAIGLIIVILFAVWLVYEAYSSHAILHRVRKLLVEKYEEE